MRILIALVAMLPTLSAAADCTVRSGPRTNALIELYTSEGCSSCPPADRWLSSFTAVAGVGQVVPVAFHVSYWDYIGWRDAFADERFTQRQRAMAGAAGARYVYTPQVVVGGRDFPAWRSHASAARAIEAILASPARASLEITMKPAAANAISAAVSARFSDTLPAADLELVVAATQNGLSSRVTAGENRGEQLRHDFVTRELRASRASGSARIEATLAFAPKADWNLDKMAVVAFLQNVKTGEVLQALSAPICR